MFTKKWLIKSLISSLAVTGFVSTILTAHAGAPIQITNAYTQSVDINTTDTIDISKGEKLTINYCISEPANMTVAIYKAIGTTSSEKVKTLSYNESKAEGCHSAVWDGSVSNKSSDGAYFYGIDAVTSDGYSAYVADWVYVKESGTTIIVNNTTTEKLKIEDIEIDNDSFDPWNNEEAEITFTLNKDSYITFEIFDEDDDEVVTLIDNESYKKGEYTVEWDGEDDDDDIVDEGDYTFELTAKINDEKDKETGEISVSEEYNNVEEETEDPRLKDVYATKTEFDPGRKEISYLVFTLTADADVQIEIYNVNGKKIEELYDENELSAGTYAVTWDGEEAIDFEGEYTYKITAKNSAGKDIQEEKITVADDKKEDKKPNVYKDKVSEIPYEPQNNNLEISFTLDKDAEVTIEIRDDEEAIVQIIDEEELTEGHHTMLWDGKDEYGEYAYDGVYEYKIIATNNKGKDVEKGYFSVEEPGTADNSVEKCGGFSDVDESYKYCEAVEWAKNKGIFEGYKNETFKPNDPIKRVEALKVVLEALDIRTLSADGENFGFKDVNRYEWYGEYLKTALSLGIVSGYPDGTFKPERSVSRIEAIVMLLNTAKAKCDLNIPTNNYGQPYYDTPNEANTKWYLSYAWFAKANNLTDNEYYLYPSDAMTRGEMADMLYRFSKMGL